MSRFIDFWFTVKLPPAGEHRVHGYVTSKGEFRLWEIGVGYSLHFGFQYRKGEYVARGESSLYTSCPPYLKTYVNSPAFRKAAALELRRIAKRFESAARDLSEGSAP